MNTHPLLASISAQFDPYPALLGGLLIGISATLLLAVHGRVAGISGILAGALDPGASAGQRAPRLLFLSGLLLGALPLALWMPERFGLSAVSSGPAVILAGLLVGFGTRLGSGCTSGHGVCGLSRLSKRSLVATCTFLAAGVVTVTLMRIWGAA